MTDKELIHQYLDKHPAALDALVRRHIHMVYATARRQVGAAHADDVTQAVFVLLMKRIRGLRNRENLAGWLYRAAVYCAANVRKSESRRQKHEREASMRTPVTSHDPPQARELQTFLDDALAGLPNRDREVILVRYLQQKSYAETADNLGISEEAARKRSDRGLEKLRAFFVAKGYAAPAAGLTAMLATQTAIKASPVLVSTTVALVRSAAVPAAVAALSHALSGTLWWTNAKIAAAVAAATLVVAAFSVPVVLVMHPNQPPAPPAAIALAASPAPPPRSYPPVPPPREVIDVSNLPAFAGLDFTHVTVDFDNAPPDDAARIFATATGIPTQVDASAPMQTGGGGAAGTAMPMLTMHVHDVPLLHAVFQLSRITQAYPHELSSRQVALAPGTTSVPQRQTTMGVWSVAGPFAMEISGIEKSADTGRAMPGGSPVLAYAAFFAEPSLNILNLPDTIAIDEFVDDQGQTIQFQKPRGSGRRQADTLSRSQLVIPLSLPESPGTKIAVLRGTATFLLSGNTQLLRNTANDQSETLPAGDLVVETLPMIHVAPQPNAQLSTYRIPIRFRRGNMDPARWNELVPALKFTRVTTLSIADERIRTANYYNQTRESDDSVLVTFNTAGGMAGVKGIAGANPHHIQIEIPQDVRSVPMPFAFKDIPLP